MFGLSLAGLFVTLFSTVSAISTLLILACCFVSGKSSSTQDEAFKAYLLQKQAAANLTDIPPTDVAHRNYPATVSSTAAKAGHRTGNASPRQAEQAIEQANQAVQNEEPASVVKE